MSLTEKQIVANQEFYRKDHKVFAKLPEDMQNELESWWRTLDILDSNARSQAVALEKANNMPPRDDGIEKLVI